MDSRPPPAPARACATLSLCCAATACAAGDPEGAFCAWACGCAAAGRGLEGVGAAVLSDMVADVSAGLHWRDDEDGVARTGCRMLMITRDIIDERHRVQGERKGKSGPAGVEWLL